MTSPSTCTIFPRRTPVGADSQTANPDRAIPFPGFKSVLTHPGQMAVNRSHKLRHPVQLSVHAGALHPTTEINRRRYIRQQPGRRALFVLVINRLSTGHFVPPSFQVRISLFVPPKRRWGKCSRFAGGKRDGSPLSGSPRLRPGLPRPAPPRRPAVRSLDPTGPWCVRVLDSTGSASHGQ